MIAFPGTAAECEISLSEILRHSDGCAGIVMAHNHPSCDPKPSKADIDLTHRLAKLMEAVDISVLDHLIFGGGEMVSLRQLGWL